MSKKVKNKNDEIYRNYSWKQAGMLVQFILIFFLIVFAIFTIFIPEFKLACFLVMGLVLLVMAYNNHKIYKKKAFTIPYIIGSLLAFWSSIEILISK